MSDLIDRQAAIEVVQNRHIMLNKEKVLLINDLDKLPSAQLATDTNVGTKLSTNLAQLGTDCISRQAAIDIAKELTITLDGYEMSNQAVMNYCAEIMQLPPIQPKRGKWEWIEEHGRYECSECGEMADDLIMGYPRWNFCPYCGAMMEK